MVQEKNQNWVTNDEEDIASALSDRYLNLVTPANVVVNNNRLYHSITSIRDSMFLFPTTNNEKISTLVNFKHNNSKDVNDMRFIPIKFLLICLHLY